MESKPLKLVIVEGPAGSGKTSLIKGLMSYDLYPGFVVPTTNTTSFVKIERPRDYGNAMTDNGAYLSLMKDIHNIVQAATYHKQHPDSTMIIDRGFISQYVYGSMIRNGIWSYTDFKSYWLQSVELIETVVNNYFLRATDRIGLRPFNNWDGKIHLMVLWYLPEIETIKRRRHFSGKTYAFDPQKEFDRYNDLVVDVVDDLKVFREEFHLIIREDQPDYKLLHNWIETLKI